MKFKLKYCWGIWPHNYNIEKNYDQRYVHNVKEDEISKLVRTPTTQESGEAAKYLADLQAQLLKDHIPTSVSVDTNGTPIDFLFKH